MDSSPAPTANVTANSHTRDISARFARFVSGAGDVEGLLAYALHTKAFVAFRARFSDEAGRAPTDTDDIAFLIGDTDPDRIIWYRAEATRLLAARETAAAHGMPRQPGTRRNFWPRFGLMPDAARSAAESGPANWKGLIARLAVLLLAVITTALMLRILVIGQ